MKHNFCPSCGNELEQEYKFCPSCGNELKATVSSPTKKEARQENTKQTSNSYLILLVSFLFAITVVFLVLRSNQHSEADHVAADEAPNQSGQPSEQMNQLMQSVLETRKALQEDPLNYDLNVKMGNNSFDIGRFKEAVKYYRTALSVKDSDPDVLIDLGVAYFNLNASDSAIFFMNSALDINPKHPQGLFNAGVVHFNIGDSLQAIEYWEKLVATNADLPQAKTAQKFIEQLKNKINKS